MDSVWITYFSRYDFHRAWIRHGKISGPFVSQLHPMIGFWPIVFHSFKAGIADAISNFEWQKFYTFITNRHLLCWIVWFAAFLLKLELLTQFPASNGKKSSHILSWIVWFIGRPPQAAWSISLDVSCELTSCDLWLSSGESLGLVMGFDVVRFRCDLTSGHKCDLCHQVLDNPVRSPCGHTFCSGCVLPPVIQNALCPAEGCSREVTADQLKNVLELRTRILCMPVICDFSGCGQVVSLEELTCHLSTCDHRPVRCHHQGCTAILPQVDMLQHETGTCPYRPAGICQQGCGLLLRHNQHEGHDCVKSLLDQLQQQERSISSLEGEVSTLRSSFQHREKLLLARISSLHHQIQTQTREFQNRLRNYQSQVVEFTRKAAVSEVSQSESRKFKIFLSRFQSSFPSGHLHYTI